MKPTIPMIVAMLWLLPCSAARATPPFYDPGAYCRRITQHGGAGEQTFRTCYRQEQAAFNRIKLYWNGLAVRSRAYCDGVAESVGSSYQVLEACLLQQGAVNGDHDGKEPLR